MSKGNKNKKLLIGCFNNSVILNNGMFVAYPAAIPLAPFTSKFGNNVLKIVGSVSVSSKLLIKG